MTLYTLCYERDGRSVVEQFDSATGRALRMIELPSGTEFEVSETSEDLEARNQILIGQHERQRLEHLS